MAEWKLKGCPKCGGDVFLDSLEHRWFEQCLQCSYMREIENLAEFYQPALEKEPALVRKKKPAW